MGTAPLDKLGEPIPSRPHSTRGSPNDNLPKRGPPSNKGVRGWCWWYRKYAPGDTVLEGLETEARDACGPIHSRCRRGVEEEEKRCRRARSGVHAVKAIVNDGLNRDRIEPPRPF